MFDHLQSRGTQWRQCANYVKVRGTLSKIDVHSKIKNILMWPKNSVEEKIHLMQVG